MVNILYNIVAYKNPEQVARLLNRVLTDSDMALVHFDTLIGKRKFEDWQRLIEKKTQGKNVRVISQFRCKYGSFGQVEVLLSTIKYYEKFSYDYLIDLTGDCYPIKPIATIKMDLLKADSSFLEFFKIPCNEWYCGGINRINNRFFFIPRRSYPYVWRLSFPRLRRGLPCGLEPYGGRGNLCLLKSHANYVLRYTEENPQVKKFFKRVYAPDEMFFETILVNSPFKSNVINDSKLYVDFSQGKTNPKNLTEEDFRIFGTSGKHFARKFNLNEDKDVLDLIDKEIDNM